MNIRQAQSALKKIKADVRRERVWAVERALQKGRDDAQIMSSGPLTAWNRRTLDYPYARRHGPRGWTVAMPGGTPAIINEGRGVFKRAWFYDPPRVTDGGRTVNGRLTNASDVADYLQFGTKNMVQRPIALVLMKSMHRHLANELQSAARRLEYTHA